MKTKELLVKRAGLIHEARGVLDAAGDEGMSAEDEQRYDKLMAEALKIGETVDRMQKLEDAERDLDQVFESSDLPDPNDEEDREAEFQREARAKLIPFLRAAPGVESSMELRALSAGSDIYGGYLVTPVQFVADLIQAVDNQVFMRQWATVHQVPNADTLGAASLDNDPADPTWTSEILVGSEDSTMSFGKRELQPHPLAQYIKVSKKLLRQVSDVEGLVRKRLAYKFGVVFENTCLNGDGAGQPLGVFVASDDGISTGRDASTGNDATSIKFDGLFEAKYTLKGQYWPRAKWMFHRDGVKQIAKLKDGEGQYIWIESVRVGEPDRILGFPVYMSEYAPNTFTTGLYVGILGDFSNYWIADALNMDLQLLVELYALTNQVALVGRLESDGMPVLEEAFVRVTLA